MTEPLQMTSPRRIPDPRRDTHVSVPVGIARLWTQRLGELATSDANLSATERSWLTAMRGYMEAKLQIVGASMGE